MRSQSFDWIDDNGQNIAKVSLDRVSHFLQQVLNRTFRPPLSSKLMSFQTELIDEFTPSNAHGLHSIIREDILGIRATTFSWSEQDGEASTPLATRAFRLHIDEELNFEPSHVNLVVGPTGSGKTALLLALLGECNPYRPYICLH